MREARRGWNHASSRRACG
uniref:Uncharacterized protein n=1 Tax=Arundo donax TaxID=35708 RepID=A0A0A9BE90_ARUDO